MSRIFSLLTILLSVALAVDLSAKLDCVSPDGCIIGQKSFNFLLVGDTGGNPIVKTTRRQWKTAESMTEVMHDKQAQFVLNVGDNFYIDGVSSVDDSRFGSTFEEPYKTFDIPWYMIAGNHDHLGSVQAQIDYTNHSERWTFPDYNYVIKSEFGAGLKAVFVLFDTIRMCDDKDKFDKGWFKYIKWVMNSADEATQPAEENHAQEMSQWIEQQLLENQDADYLFVVGHYPVYSVSSHGNNECIKTFVDPLLRRHKVSAYLSGHDHTLQHIVVADESGTSMDYIVSGAGSRGDKSAPNIDKVPKESLKFRYPTWGIPFDVLGAINHGGFVNVELDEEKAQFVFYNDEKDHLYETRIGRREH